MFDKIQMMLMIKTSISNNRIPRLNYTEKKIYMCSLAFPISLCFTFVQFLSITVLVQMFHLFQLLAKKGSPEENKISSGTALAAFYGAYIIFTTLHAIDGFNINKYLNARLMTLLMFIIQTWTNVLKMSIINSVCW